MRIWGMRPGISFSLTAGDRHRLEAISCNRNAPQKQLLPPSWAQRPPRSAVPIGKGGARSMELTRRARVGGPELLFRRILFSRVQTSFAPAALWVLAAAALAFTGPGLYSLDHAFGLQSLAGFGWGLAAVVVGALSGLAVVARARRTLATDAAGQAVMQEPASA